MTGDGAPRSKKRLVARAVKPKPPSILSKEGKAFLHGMRSKDRLRFQLEALNDAQAEVERARRHYEDLYDFAPVGYISFDEFGVVREVNLTAASLLEHTRTIIIGSPFAVFVAKENISAFMTHLIHCKRGESRVVSEIVLKRGSGRFVPAQIVSNPFPTSAGSLFRTVITDLTERKRGEEALRHAHEELEKRIQERTAELVTANEELQGEIRARQRLEGEILEISEREQRRIGQDLHDGICQHLAALSFMAKAAAIRLAKDKNNQAVEIDQLSSLLTDAVGQTRDLARGLHPVELDRNGLMSALHELAASMNGAIQTSFECAHPVPIEDGVLSLNLYRIAQEAMTNAVKHSNAKRIDVRLAVQRGEIVITVHDDGRGLSKPPAKSKGMGMHIMNYRAKVIGASLKVASRAGGGTRVACSIPAPKP